MAFLEWVTGKRFFYRCGKSVMFRYVLGGSVYDRYDSNKSSYVSYEYEPIGDRFSRGLSETPRSYKKMQHMETGNVYYRRTRTDEAQSITITQFKRWLPDALREGLEHRTLYFDDHKHDFLAFVPIRLEPPGLALRFELTEQHKGKRLWFLCPHCHRRVSKLYRIRAKYHFLRLWGCQKCLGLTYPSQAAHKSLARDSAIINGQIKVSWWEEWRAIQRYRRRIMKLDRSIAHLMSRLV